jgi:hypothetical protein
LRKLRPALVVKKPFNIPAAAHHMENEPVFTFDAVDNNALTDWETAQAGAQVMIAVAANLRLLDEQLESPGNGVDKVVDNLYAAALWNNAKPDAVKFSFGFW